MQSRSAQDINKIFYTEIRIVLQAKLKLSRMGESSKCTVRENSAYLYHLRIAFQKF